MALFTEGEEQPQPLDVNGVPMVCHHCQNETFYVRGSIFEPEGTVGFNWARMHTKCLICSECGYMHWFTEKK